MNKQHYFERINTTSKEVDILLENLLIENEFITFENIDQLSNKRKNKPKMRSFLTQLAYELCKGEGEITIANTISEINNIHLYLDNWILDNKNAVFENNKTQETISNITINSQIYRELTDIAISNLNLPSEQELDLRTKFNQQIINCYRGQRVELELDISKINSFANDDEYIKKYIQKSELLSGYAYGLSAYIGGLISDSNEKTNSNLFNFGKTLGTGLHISNDLGDFAILNKENTFKSYQDQQADLMNGRLTPPTYFILKYGSKEEQETIMTIYEKKQESTNEEKKLAAKTIFETDAYKFSFNIIKPYWKNAKSQLHKNFEKTEARDLLSIMTSSIRTNKYLHALKQI